MQVGALDALLKALLPVTRVIDAVTTWIGKRLAWLILAAVVVSAVNATVRKIFDTSSNSWLELQWVLFSIVFLLCSPWTLLANEHIRIDIVNNMLPKRLRDSIDVVGHAFFLLPLTIVMIITGIPFFLPLDRDQRAVGKCRRPAAMAGQVAGHDRVRHAAHSRHVGIDQAHRGDARPHSGSARGTGPRPRSRGRAYCRSNREALSARSGPRSIRMEAILIHNMAPIMFGSLVVFLLLGYPAAFSLGAVGLIFALHRHRARPVRAGLPASLARTRLRRDEQRHAAGDPVLHLHGVGARTIRHGGGPARHHRAIVRHRARRPRLCGRLRRRAARRHHRRGRGLGDFDGADLAADHAALRL